MIWYGMVWWGVVCCYCCHCCQCCQCCHCCPLSVVRCPLCWLVLVCMLYVVCCMLYVVCYQKIIYNCYALPLPRMYMVETTLYFCYLHEYTVTIGTKVMKIESTDSENNKTFLVVCLASFHRFIFSLFFISLRHFLFSPLPTSYL